MITSQRSEYQTRSSSSLAEKDLRLHGERFMPALRKQGYMPLRRLRAEIKAWEKNPKDVETHGERVESLQHFRKLAKECEGSRDVGAQLFVALLRGLGLETRMVANLQPAGFGWSKAEDANEKKSTKKNSC